MVDLVLLASLSLALLMAGDVYRRIGTAMLFHGFTLYLGFHCLVFVLRPLLTYHFGFNSTWAYMGIWPTDHEYVVTSVVSIVGLVACYAGFVLGYRPGPPVRLGAARPHRLEPPSREETIAFVLVATVFLPLGFYSLLDARSTHENMIMTASGIRVFKQGSGYIAYAYHAIGPLLLLFAALNRFRLWSLLPFAIYVAYRIDLGWGRFGFVLLLMSLGLLWTYLRGLSWRLFALGALTVTLFQYAGRTRGENNVTTVWYNKLDNLDYSNFDFLTFILRQVPEQTGTYTYFTQYLQLVTEPIPRVLWADKPIGSPVQFFNLNQYGNFVGLTNSAVGDGWMSLGYAGVILTLLITGLGLSAAFNWFRKNQYRLSSTVIYAVALPASVTWFRDGGIGVIKIWFFLAVPIVIWAILARQIYMLQSHDTRGKEMVPGSR